MKLLRGLAGIVLIICTGYTGWAMQPPDPAEIEQLRKDGRLKEALARVEEIGDHEVAPALVERAQAKLKTGLGKLAPSVFPGGQTVNLPSTGNNKILVFLMDFPDFQASTASTLVTFSNVFNGSGNAWNPHPYESLRNYYRRSSYNTLDLTADIYGWHRMGHNRSWYGNDEKKTPYLMSEEVISAYDSTIDYSQYDNNGDGRVDNYVLVWAGQNVAWTSVWWAFNYRVGAYENKTIKRDNVEFSNYTWMPEFWRSAGRFSAQVLMHETGHALGLPDYYDYDDSKGPRGGVGGQEMMQDNEGDHNAFSKWLLDWLVLTPVRADYKQIALMSVSENNEAFAINVRNNRDGYQGVGWNEFYIVEYRRKVNNDKNITEAGVGIWHVDAQCTGDRQFKYNNSYTDHKLLRRMEADGAEDIENGRGFGRGDMYRPGVRGAGISAFSTPSSADYGGQRTGIYMSQLDYYSYNTNLVVMDIGWGNKMDLVWPGNNACFYVGRTNMIWVTYPGGTTQLHFYYSTNNGSAYSSANFPNPIPVAVFPRALLYKWYIPNYTYASQQARLMVADANDTYAYAESTPFKVLLTGASQFSCIAPSASNRWLLGTTNTIRWTVPEDAPANVRIQYSADNGSTWSDWNLPASVNTRDGSYTWIIPDDPEREALRARLRLVGVENNFCATSAAFRMINPSPVRWDLVSLPGHLTLGQATLLRWTNMLASAMFQIQFSFNGGRDFVVLTNVDSLASQCQVSLPMLHLLASTNARLRIVDLSDDTENSADNSSAFQVIDPIPRLEMVAPTENDAWQLGQTYDIQWTAPTTMVAVGMYLSWDDGYTWSILNFPSTLPASNGLYSWTLPKNPIYASTAARIRVFDKDHPLDNYITSEKFTIQAPVGQRIQILAPRYTDHWGLGQSRTISWVAPPLCERLQLQYSWDGGASYSTMNFPDYVPATNGYYNWTIPSNSVYTSTTARIRIDDYDYPGLYRQESENFRVSEGGPVNIEVSEPSAGDAWIVGFTYPIQWNAPAGTTNVQIQYSWDDGTNYTTFGFPDVLPASPGWYDWTIPVDVATSGLARIQIVDYDRALDVFGVSARFSVGMDGWTNIYISSPFVGSPWAIGQRQVIRWTAPDMSRRVQLQYSWDDGATWTIANLPDYVMSSVGEYEWNIPRDETYISQTARVRVIDYDLGARVMGDSDRFVMNPSFNLNITSRYGYVYIAPDEGCYPPNTLVYLQAQPKPAYTFSHWAGDAGGGMPETTVMVDTDKFVSAEFIVADFELDRDHDRVPDWQEDIAGTDPENSNDFFHITNVVAGVASGQQVLFWHCVAGRRYAVYVATNLLDAEAFQLLTNNLSCPESGDLSFTDTVESAFWRAYSIKVEDAP